MTLRDRITDHRRELFVVLICVAMFALTVHQTDVHLVYNSTPSLPEGFYRLEPIPRSVEAEDLDGQLVWLELPPALQREIESRRYIPRGAHLAKRVVALPGDRWCVRDGRWSIEGQDMGPVFETDTRGRRLGHPTGCHMLGSDEFLVATELPRSFDSRYFGPVERRALLGTLEDAWTW
jgi:conjugative transfer signal peptidase TraF